MANRNFPASRQFGFHLMPVSLCLQASIGASGAPTAVNSLGITSITRMSAGRYRIRLQDNYAELIALNARMQAPPTGGNVAVTAISPGVVYQINALGTTTQAQWVTAGVPAGVTAAPGVVFLAAATSAGTGNARLLGSSGVVAVEVMGSNVNMLNSQPFSSGNGGYVDIQCMGSTAADNTAMIPTDPVEGSQIIVQILLNNSKVQ